MRKIIFRAGILFAVFIASLIFFYNTVDEHSFAEDVVTVESGKAVLPIVSFSVNGNEINQTKGHTVLCDENYPRESVTPLSTAKNFSVLVKENDSSVKLVAVSVFELPSLNEIAGYETNRPEKGQDGRLAAEFTVSEQLAENTEYLLRVTLTLSTGDKVYYYTRVQVSNFGSLTESLAFINNFHSCTFDKNKVYELEGVMESSDDIVSDYSHIDIHSNMEALSYGVMAPVQKYCFVPQITEYNTDYVSAALYFWIEADTENGKETFKCKEAYRFRYTASRTYLYNYDRTMETCFDGSNSVSPDKELRLGVTGKKELDRIYSEDRTQMLFSHQGTLWHFDMKKNKLVRVLSYKNDDSAGYDRDGAEDYDFELLSVDGEGNADFAVYGQIGKGVYEGRTGVIYYHYYASDERIEEQMFIPVSVEYEELEGEFGKVSYTTEQDIFYFTLFDAFYSYELETNVLKTEVENLGKDWIYFEDINLLCYNQNPDVSQNRRIVLHDVAKNTDLYIDADEGMFICLLGTVDGRIVYGLGNPEQISFYDDGETFLPVTKMVIADTDSKSVRDYEPPEGKYVGGISFEQGTINLTLYTLVSEKDGDSKAVFEYFGQDVIINLNKTPSETDDFTKRVSSITGTEYFLMLPSVYESEEKPSVSESVSTVIRTDTSALIRGGRESRYHVSAYGSMVMSTDMLGEALACADEALGSVVDGRGNVIWQRGIVRDSASVDGVKVSYANDGRSSEQAVIQMLMDFRGVSGDASEFNMKEKSMYEWMQESLGESSAMIRGASLDEVLYFVSSGKPVIATYDNYYVVIIGYSAENVTWLDPMTGNKTVKTKEAARSAFEKAGGTYYVY